MNGSARSSIKCSRPVLDDLKVGSRCASTRPSSVPRGQPHFAILRIWSRTDCWSPQGRDVELATTLLWRGGNGSRLQPDNSPIPDVLVLSQGCMSRQIADGMAAAMD